MNYPYQQPQQSYAFQQRLAYQQPWNINQQQSIIPIIRPVSSIEEVKASPIDFDGSTFYFSDVVNKRIYTKAINPDGTVSINLYELKQVDQPGDSSYVTRQEFEKVINQLIKTYEDKLNSLQEIPQAAAQPQQSFNF